jgi:hypothetical protein
MGHNKLEKAILWKLLSPYGINTLQPIRRGTAVIGCVLAAGGAGPGGGTRSCRRSWTAESSASWRTLSARRDICLQTWSRSVIGLSTGSRTDIGLSTGSRSVICLLGQGQLYVYWVKVSCRSIYWSRSVIGLTTGSRLYSGAF